MPLPPFPEPGRPAWPAHRPAPRRCHCTPELGLLSGPVGPIRSGPGGYPPVASSYGLLPPFPGGRVSGPVGPMATGAPRPVPGARGLPRSPDRGSPLPPALPAELRRQGGISSLGFAIRSTRAHVRTLAEPRSRTRARAAKDKVAGQRPAPLKTEALPEPRRLEPAARSSDMLVLCRARSPCWSAAQLVPATPAMRPAAVPDNDPHSDTSSPSLPHC